MPTTAGTAAEVTINYVITDVEKKRKFVCVDPHDMPVIAVVDPDMMSSMPKGLTAATGMDALTHAIEGYTTKAACAMMLPIVMEYNADCTGEKYREIARAMGVKGVDDMSVEEYRKAAIDAVRQLSVDVGIPTKLEAIKEDDLQFLAESAYADACAPGNPKDASVEDLKELFRKIM